MGALDHVKKQFGIGKTELGKTIATEVKKRANQRALDAVIMYTTNMVELIGEHERAKEKIERLIDIRSRRVVAIENGEFTIDHAYPNVRSGIVFDDKELNDPEIG